MLSSELNKGEKRNELKTIFAVVLLIVLDYFLLGPLQIYASNPMEFRFEVRNFIGWLILLSIVAVVILVAVLYFLPARIQKYTLLAFGYVGFMSYLQGNFLNGKISRLDGNSMLWILYKKEITINTIIWIAILFVFVLLMLKKEDIWKKLVTILWGLLDAVLLLTFIITIIVIPKERDDKYDFDYSGQFQVSAGNNIIIFILDRYGNERFESMLSKWPEAALSLKDFTYYSNADSRYMHTFPSIYHLLSGNEYDYSMSEEEWISGVWGEEKTRTMYERIHESGYKVHLYTTGINSRYGQKNGLLDTFDNVKFVMCGEDARLILQLLLKTCVFKNVPYILKPCFEGYLLDAQALEYKDRMLYSNYEYYDYLKAAGLSIDENLDNLLVINHINGMHNPYNIDQYANRIPNIDIENPNYDEIAKGLQVIVDLYLSELKDLGVYEDATIFIIGDHGDFQADGGVQPLFLLKLPGEEHDSLVYNAAPITHHDILPTIMGILGDNDSIYGTTIFDWKEGDRRERMLDNYTETTYYTDRYELKDNVFGADLMER